MSLSPAGLVHSIQARLKNEAQARGRPFAELLELFAIERFLHRLGRSEHREPGPASCQRSPEPVFLKWKDMEASPEGDFYVRSGPGSVRLTPRSTASREVQLP